MAVAAEPDVTQPVPVVPAVAQADGRSIVVGPDGETGSIPLIGPYLYPPVEEESAQGRPYYIMMRRPNTAGDTYFIYFFSSDDFKALEWVTHDIVIDGVTKPFDVSFWVASGRPYYAYSCWVPDKGDVTSWGKLNDYGLITPNRVQLGGILPYALDFDAERLGYFYWERSNVDIIVDGKNYYPAYPIEDQGKPLPPDGEGDVEQDTSFWGRIKKFFAGTWDTVTGWFAARWHDFVGWLRSFFVPADGFWTGFFDGIKAFCAEHFGFLYDVPVLIGNILGKFRDFDPSATPSLRMPAIDLPLFGRTYHILDSAVIEFDMLTQAPYSVLYGVYKSFVWCLFGVALLNFGRRTYDSVFGGGGGAD